MRTSFLKSPWFIVLSIALVTCNCQGKKSKGEFVSQEPVSEIKVITTVNKPVTNESIQDTNISKSEVSENIPDTSDNIQPSCLQTEKYNEGMDDSIIIKTCFFKRYKSVSTGTPDYKGRYSWEYEMFRMMNGRYMEVKNTEVFNDKQAQLMALINKKIHAEYKKYTADPETKECLDGVDITQQYAIDDLGIDFDNNQFNFSVSLGLDGACYVVDITTVSFNFGEIQVYLK